MNHKPRTRLAALLLVCLLLCPSPGRSEAAVQTDVPVPQEDAIPAEETLESQETVQEPAATPAEEAAQEVEPTEAPALPTETAPFPDCHASSICLFSFTAGRKSLCSATQESKFWFAAVCSAEPALAL